MDGIELNVDECSLDKRCGLDRLIADEFLQRILALARNGRIARARSFATIASGENRAVSESFQTMPPKAASSAEFNVKRVFRKSIALLTICFESPNLTG